MEHILNLEQVKKYYGGNSGNITKAVDGISMYVDKGEFVGSRSGGKPDSVMVVSGIKKQATAKPWINCGRNLQYFCYQGG